MGRTKELFMLCREIERRKEEPENLIAWLKRQTDIEHYWLHITSQANRVFSLTKSNEFEEYFIQLSSDYEFDYSSEIIASSDNMYDLIAFCKHYKHSYTLSPNAYHIKEFEKKKDNELE